jgi:uncharacterized membrane protein (UPF0127 family)
VSHRAWLAAGAAGLLVIAGIGLFLLGDALTSGDDGSSSASTSSLARAVAAARPAGDPFARMTETTVHVGGEALRVVVADESFERYQGLRGRADIGDYDGMLFVFDEPTSTNFTMSTVRTALDLGLYGSDGRPVDRLRMEPCRFGESDCPLYRPEGEFRYAIETLPGDLPRGDLSG